MIDREILDNFVLESLDMLDHVEPKLIEMEASSEATGAIDMEEINAIFRLFHSMKGSASFLQFDNITAITHEAETLLDLFRKQKLTISREHISLLCRTMDQLRHLLEVVQHTQTDASLEQETKKIAGELSRVIKEGRNATASAAKEAAPQPPAASENKEENDAPTTSDPGEIPISKEFIERFVQESDEALETAERALLSLSESPDEGAERINEAFRSIHSLKGNAGFMGFADIQSLSHALEEVLEAMKTDTTICDENNIGLLLRIIDVLREGVADISKSGKGEIKGYPVMIDLLRETIATQAADPSGAKRDEPPSILVVDDEPEVLETIRVAMQNIGFTASTCTSAEEALQLIEKYGSKLELLLTDIAMPRMDGVELITAIRKKLPSLPIMVLTAYGNKKLLVRLMELGVDEFLEKPFAMADLAGKIKQALAKGKERAEAAEAKAKMKAAAGGEDKQPHAIARRDIRVDIDKLDALVNLIGELVIAESMVTRNPEVTSLELESFERASHQLRRIATDLQDVALSLRMVPLSSTFRKMIRLVHDLSQKVGKEVKLELVGEETEVDKTVIEQISDPLVHIVRNSVDHGMEKPEERIAKGKPEIGTITVEGRHEGGEVWILIRDDGKGLDRNKILAKAIERGLVAQGENLRDDEVHRLIFEPGFSTADAVTDISGRGVGMDVVKKNIEKLKGRVDVRSTPGQGTTVILRIPLTLAIIEGMLVRVGESRYTIPMLAIRESLRPTPEQITITMDGQELVRIREELIPVLRLHSLYGIKPDREELAEGILVVIEEDNKSVALFIDEIVGQHQTVIKGLSSYLKAARGVSGCTILGDGEVSLILDVRGLLALALERKPRERSFEPVPAAN